MKFPKFGDKTTIAKTVGVVFIISSVFLIVGYVNTSRQKVMNVYDAIGKLSYVLPTTVPKQTVTNPTPTKDVQPDTTASITQSKKSSYPTSPATSTYSHNITLPTVTITAGSFSFEVIPDYYDCRIKVRATLVSSIDGIWRILFTYSTPQGFSESIASYPSFSANQPLVVEQEWGAVAAPGINKITVSMLVTVLNSAPGQQASYTQQINFSPPAPVTIEC